MSAARRRTRLVACVLAAGLAGLAGAALAADGAALYKARICDSCHGENGSRPVTPDYPSLAGQNAKYLLRQMIDIRDGHRNNGLSATMRPVVVGVSDEEFAAIAEWLSQQF
jgi:cytochrome c